MSATCCDSLHAYRFVCTSQELFRFSFVLKQWRSVVVEGLTPRVQLCITTSQSKLLFVGGNSIGQLSLDSWGRDTSTISAHETPLDAIIDKPLSACSTRFGSVLVVDATAQVHTIDLAPCARVSRTFDAPSVIFATSIVAVIDMTEGVHLVVANPGEIVQLFTRAVTAAIGSDDGAQWSRIEQPAFPTCSRPIAACAKAARLTLEPKKPTTTPSPKRPTQPRAPVDAREVFCVCDGRNMHMLHQNAAEATVTLQLPCDAQDVAWGGSNRWLVIAQSGESFLFEHGSWERVEAATQSLHHELVPVQWHSAPSDAHHSRLLLRLTSLDDRLIKSHVREIPKTKTSAGKATVEVVAHHPHDTQVSLDSHTAPLEAVIKADYVTDEDDTAVIIQLIDVQRLINVRIEQSFRVGDERRRRTTTAKAEVELAWQQLHTESRRLGDLQRRLAEWDAKLDEREDVLEAAEADLNRRIDALNRDISMVQQKNDKLNADRVTLEHDRETEREHEAEAEKRRRADKEKQRQHERQMEAEKKREEKALENLNRATEAQQMAQSKLEREINRIARERDQHRRDAQWAKEREQQWSVERHQLEKSIQHLREEATSMNANLDKMNQELKSQRNAESALRDENTRLQSSIEYFEGRLAGEPDTEWLRRKEVLTKSMDNAVAGKWVTGNVVLDACSNRDNACITFVLGSMTPAPIMPTCRLEIAGDALIVTGTVEFEVGEGYIVGDVLRCANATALTEKNLARCEGSDDAHVQDIVKFTLLPGAEAAAAIQHVFQAVAFMATNSSQFAGTRRVEFVVSFSTTRHGPLTIAGHVLVLVLPPALEAFREAAPFHERAAPTAVFGHMRVRNPLSDLTTRAYQTASAQAHFAKGFKGHNRGLLTAAEGDDAPDVTVAFSGEMMYRFSAAAGRRCLTCCQPRLAQKVVLNLLGNQDSRAVEGMFSEFELVAVLEKVQPEDVLVSSIPRESADQVGAQLKIEVSNGTELRMRSFTKMLTRETIAIALQSICFHSTGVPLDDAPRKVTYTVRLAKFPIPLEWTATREISIVNSAHHVEVSADNVDRVYRLHSNTVTGLKNDPPTLWFASDVCVTDPFTTKFKGTATFTLRHPTHRVHKDVLCIRPFGADARLSVARQRRVPPPPVPVEDVMASSMRKGNGLRRAVSLRGQKQEPPASPSAPSPSAFGGDGVELAEEFEGSVSWDGVEVATYVLLDSSTRLEIIFTAKTTAVAATGVLRSVTFSTADVSPLVRRTVQCVAALGRGVENQLTFTVTSQLPIVAVERLGGLKWTEHQGPVPAGSLFGLNSPMIESKAPPVPECWLSIVIMEGMEIGDTISFDPGVLLSADSTAGPLVSHNEAAPLPVLLASSYTPADVVSWVEAHGGCVWLLRMRDGSILLRIANDGLKIPQAPPGSPVNRRPPSTNQCHPDDLMAIRTPPSQVLQKQTLVKQLLACITYEHKSNTPGIFRKVLSVRSMDMTGSYSDASVSLHVVPVDDPTEIHDLPEKTLYCQGSRLTSAGYRLAPGARLVDPDTEDFIGGFVSIEPKASTQLSSKDRMYLLSPEQQEADTPGQQVVFVDERSRVFYFPNYDAYDAYLEQVTQEILHGIAGSDAANARSGADEGSMATLVHCVGTLVLTALHDFQASPPEGQVVPPKKKSETDAPLVEEPQPPMRWHFSFKPPRQRTITLECVQTILRCIAFENTSGRINTRDREFVVQLGAGALSAAVNVEGAKVADKTVMTFAVKVMPAVFFVPPAVADVVYQKGTGVQPITKSVMTLPLSPYVKVHRARLVIRLVEPPLTRTGYRAAKIDLQDTVRSSRTDDDEYISLALRRDSGLEIRGNQLVALSGGGAVAVSGQVTTQTKSTIVIEFSPSARIDAKQLQILVRSVSYNCSAPPGVKQESSREARIRRVEIALENALHLPPPAMLDSEDSPEQPAVPAVDGDAPAPAADEGAEGQVATPMPAATPGPAVEAGIPAEPAAGDTQQPTQEETSPAAAEATDAIAADMAPTGATAVGEPDKDQPVGETAEPAKDAESKAVADDDGQHPVREQYSALYRAPWDFACHVNVWVTSEPTQPAAIAAISAEAPFQIQVPEKPIEYTMRCGAFRIFNTVSTSMRRRAAAPLTQTWPSHASESDLLRAPATFTIFAPAGATAPLLLAEDAVVTIAPLNSTMSYSLPRFADPDNAAPVLEPTASSNFAPVPSLSLAGAGASALPLSATCVEVRYNDRVVALLTTASKAKNALTFEFLACPPLVVGELVRRVTFLGGGKRDKPGVKHTFKCAYRRGPAFAEDNTTLTVVVTPPYVEEITAAPLAFSGPAIAPFANAKVKASVAFPDGRLTVDMTADEGAGQRLSAKDRLYLMAADGFTPQFDDEDEVTGSISVAPTGNRPAGNLGTFALTAHAFVLRVSGDSSLATSDILQSFVKNAVYVGQAPPVPKQAGKQVDVTDDTEFDFEVNYACTVQLEDASQIGCEATILVQGAAPVKKAKKKAAK
jgi:hypothetical protein